MEIIVAEVVAVLDRTPAVLRSLLANVPGPWLGRHEGEEAFGPRDVLGHLIHGERTDWIPRIRRILEHGEMQPFEPFDRRGYGDASRVAVNELLAEFATARGDSLVELAGMALGPRELDLRGRHPELGPVTLGQLLATWVVHDLNHIAQVARVMSARCASAVGPWKPYLRILRG